MNNKKVKKGSYGYINYMRKASVIKALIMYAIAATIFAAGYFYHHSKENIITVLAVLAVMPACKWTVNAIMFLRFHSRSYEFYLNFKKLLSDKDVDEHLYFFDSVLTIEKGGSYPFNIFACINGSLIGYTDDPKRDLKLIEKHLKDMCKKNELRNIGIKLFDNETAFLNRFEELSEKISIMDEEALEKDMRTISLIGALSL